MTSPESPAPAAGSGSPPGPLLELRGIAADIGSRRVLHDVGLEVGRGEIHALVGGRGSGKSSLVKVISGILPRAAGAIRFDGRPVERHTAQNALRLGITTLHQDDRLLPQMNAFENVFLNREMRWLGLFSDTRGMREAAVRAFTSMSLDIDPDIPVRFHDSNAQQMILFARLFCFAASLVVLDEPAGRLAPAGLERLHYLLSLLRQNGVTVLYAASDLDEVTAFATRVSILEAGTVRRTTRVSNVDDDRLVRLTHADLFSRRSLETSNLELSYLDGLNRSLLDTISLPLLVADTTGAVVLANRALLDLCRIPREELLRLRDDSLLPGAAERPPRAPLPFLRDGLRVDVRASPLVDPDGASMGTAFLLSAQGTAPGAGQHAAAPRLDLATMAHEINNPLGILLNHMELIRGSGSLEQVRANTEVMDGELRRIRRILSRHLRPAASPARPGDPPAPPAARVREVAEAVASLLRIRAGDAVRVTVGVEGEPAVGMEPDMLRQVILNVGINAVEAMPGGGLLAISARQEDTTGGPWVAIEVRDTGAGIPAADIERVFEPFFTTKGDPETRGLGLAVCRDIVDRRGGSIRAESAPGAGSTFRIRLPVRAAGRQLPS